MRLGTAPLLSVGILLLLTGGALTNTGGYLVPGILKQTLLFFIILYVYTTWWAGLAALPLRLSVVNALSDKIPGSYSSSVVEGGVLMGVLRRLQETQLDFK